MENKKKSKKQTIFATHKDGTPVVANSRVMLITTKGEKVWGRIIKVEKIMTFQTLRGIRMQTYRMRQDDGLIVPIHARMIKFAQPPSPNVTYVNVRRTPRAWRAAS